MFRLTTRFKFALIFSFYILCFLVSIYFIFILILNFMVDYQFKKDLAEQSTDIINNHLFFEEARVVFKKDSEGSTLKEYLLTHQSSAVFLDNQDIVLRSYGFLALNDQNLKNFINNRKDVASPDYQKLIWDKNEVFISLIPLKTKGETLGLMVLAKSLDEFNNLKQMILLAFTSFGLICILGSFLLGNILARSAFKPLKKMIEVIDKVEFDKLEQMLNVTGNPRDESVRLGNKFNEMLLRLDDMAKRQKAFVANASHELKTPLTRAISSLDLITSGSAKDKEELNLVKEDLFAVNEILERLLVLTKLKMDVHGLAKSYNLKSEELFEYLEKQFQNQLFQKKIDFKGEFTGIVSVSIPKEYLQIILTNLLSNAIKHSVPGSSIYFSVSKNPHKTTISIRDEGKGMSKEELKHIFDRFYQGETPEKGYGIGLSIVKQICNLFKIEVKVESEKDVGTKIKLYIAYPAA